MIRSLIAPLLALAFASLVTTTPAAAELPAEQFARLPALSDPVLSPNGKMIAARVAVDGVEQLITYPAGEEGRSSAIALGEVRVSSYFWVNDDWLLIEVAQPDGTLGTTMIVTRLMSFNAQTQEMIRIKADRMGQQASDVIWVARDGSPRVLLAYQQSFNSSEIGFFPEVAMVDVSKNKFNRVQAPREGVFNWIADPNGVVRVGLGSERGGRQQRLLYRARDGIDLREIGNTSDNPELPVPIAFLSQPGTAVGFSDKDGADAAYNIDLESMRLGEPLLAIKGYDLTSILLDKSGWDVAGVRYLDTRPQTMWFDPTLAGLQSTLERSLGRQVSIDSRSRDDSMMIVRAFDADRPPSYYLLSLSDQKLALLGHANPDLVQSALAPVRTVSYEARDGLVLRAVLTVPKGQEARNLPIIVLPHGGPRARDAETWDWWAQFLADRGYAVIQPNYRGSTGYGTALTDAGDGEWGLKMQDDVDDALAWAVSEGIADPGRACIVGGSYGGYVAMRAAERNPDLYRCAITFAGVADLGAMLRADRGFYNELATVDYWKGRAPDLTAVSPLQRPDKVGIPVLVVHGRRDLRVPVTQSRDYVAALRKAGKDVTYVEQREGDHHFSREEDRRQFLQAMEAFLNEHNPAT